MGFNWKEKLEKGKEIAAKKLAEATVKGEELMDKAGKAARDFANEVEKKVGEMKTENPAPAAKEEAPKNAAPKNNAPKNG